jgi:hypothetical protein
MIGPMSENEGAPRRPNALERLLAGEAHEAEQGMAGGLGGCMAPAPATAPTEDVGAVIDWLLSPEESLERAVAVLGLDSVVLMLARRHGRDAVRAALAQGAGGQRLQDGVIPVRHALTLFCERKGSRGDADVARELARVFRGSRRTEASGRAESLRKLVGQARVACSQDAWAKQAADRITSWLSTEHGGKDLHRALKDMARSWKTNPYP